MKSSSVTFVVTLSVSLIVISLLLPVNHCVSQTSPSNPVLVADGSPLPPTPPPPPAKGNQLLPADHRLPQFVAES
jgi:hypothetical protein